MLFSLKSLFLCLIARIKTQLLIIRFRFTDPVNVHENLTITSVSVVWRSITGYVITLHSGVFKRLRTTNYKAQCLLSPHNAIGESREEMPQSLMGPVTTSQVRVCFVFLCMPGDFPRFDSRIPRLFSFCLCSVFGALQIRGNLCVLRPNKI